MSELNAPSSTPTKRSTGQLIVIGIAVLIFAFLVIGTVTQSSAPEQGGFGLQTQSFLALAFLAFFGGLVSFLSPCTLPILPAYFAFAFQSGRKQIAVNTLVFMLGVATMFSLLGAGASALGRLLLGNQQLILLFGGSLIMVFGVMSLLGKGFTGMGSGDSNQPSNQTLGGTFLFGVTFAVGWSSCVGPILGVILTMAAQTGSVMRGVMLLFIYAIGLGLPLILVSTFLGRTSRKSFIWRMMRGKGWQWNTSIAVVALIWGLAIWRILVAIGEYAYRNFDFFNGQRFAVGQEYGLLVIALLAVALWFYTSTGKPRITLNLHSTQLVSGVLFILMAVLMLNGTLSTFNALVPPDLAIWFADIEDAVITFFTS